MRIESGGRSGRGSVEYVIIVYSVQAVVLNKEQKAKSKKGNIKV